MKDIAPTPGPYRIKNGEIFAGEEIIGVVYRTEGWSSGDPVEHEDQANARLIVAALDLFASTTTTPETSTTELTRVTRVEVIDHDPSLGDKRVPHEGGPLRMPGGRTDAARALLSGRSHD